MAFITRELELLSDGSAANPAFRFNASATTGLFSATPGELSLAATGVDVFTAKTGSEGVVLNVGAAKVPDGTSALPTYSFSSDPNTGMYSAGADNTGFASGGAQIINIAPEGMTVVSGIMDTPDGTAGAPSFTFTADLTSGMYKSGDGEMAFALSGVDALQLIGGGEALFPANAILNSEGGNLTLQANGGVGVLLEGNPVAALGIATKQYVDAVATGLQVKDAARVATTGTLAATRSGNVITASGNGAISIDGVSLSSADRVLVKNGLVAGDTEVAQVSDLTCVAKASYSDNASVTADYFDIFTALNADKYRVYFDFSGLDGNIPPADGLTLVRVDISLDTTATTVGVTLDGVLTALTGLGASNAAGVVTVTNSALGDAEDVDGATALSEAEMAFAVPTQGVSDGASNGIYVVTTVGDAGTAYVLTRSADADTTALVTAGMFLFIEEGTDNKDIGYVQTTDNPINVNFTNQNFAQFSSQGGSVSGPVASTVNAFARWDNATGTLLKDTSNVTMGDSGIISFVEGTTATKGIVFPTALANAFFLQDSGGDNYATFNSTNLSIELEQGRLDFPDSLKDNEIFMPLNDAPALSIKTSSDTYIDFNTNTATKQVGLVQDTKFSAGTVYNVTTIAANITLSNVHFFVRGDTSGGSVTLTLPAVANNAGRQYKIVKVSASNTLSIDPNASETIDGSSATVDLAGINDHITLISDGVTGWFTM
uniref:Uncharacterized protein n=1 Tax=Pithovirus LCPAC401 TaxID=2506595 RepID=A0A481ZCA0_9VIRU|nr:MAG: hypothetical protein LCPAC401_03880 [Pithovirus LCPAC401]